MTNTIQWHVIVPLRGGPVSKTRLANDWLQPTTRKYIAQAFASDVVVAALATTGVTSLTIVTRDDEVAAHFSRFGVEIFTEAKGAGLNGAVISASNHVRAQHPTHGLAVLMGDLPGLTPEALSEALVSGADVELGVIADHEGTGTTMLTALPGFTVHPSYGAGSFARHLAAGHQEISVALMSPLRRDVDTLEDLVAAHHTGTGPYTDALLSSLNL